MKFALFFMGEYANIFVAGALMTTLFFGGWQIPWATTALLKEHASTAALISCVAVVVGSLAMIGLLIRFYRGRKYRWHDMRDLEPLVLFGVLGLAILAALAGVALCLTLPFNAVAAAITAAVLQFGSFFVKALIFCFIVVWTRWTLPRFRYDQLMALGWKIMLPLGIANLLVTGLVLLFVKGGF